MFPARADIAPATVIRRIAHGAFWSLLGTAASRLFTVASSILVARILGREGFGGYGIVQSTIAMFAVLADLALGATATKYVADYRIREPERASRILGFSVTVALVSASLAGLSLLALSSWLASESLYAPELASALRIGALLLFVSALNGVLRGALAGFEAFRAIARINFIQAVATPLLSVPLATYLGVDGAMAAQVLVVALGAALARVSLSRLCRETNIPITLFSRPRMEEYSVFVRFSLPAILAGLLVLPVTWYCSALLARQPNGLGELGLFNAANQWRQVVLMVPQVLGMVMLPVFSEVYGRADKGGFERVVLLNLRVTWCVALPAAALVTALQHPLAMLFGKQYAGIAPIIGVLVAYCFFFSINNVVGTALAAAGRMWTGLLFNTAWAGAQVTASILLVPRLGAMGLAIAYLLSYLLHSLWQMIYVDTTLAPTSVRRQRGLLLATVVGLPAVTVAFHMGLRWLPLGVLGIAITFIPLTVLLRQWHLTTKGVEA